jgi:hypothetical protein
VINFEVSEEDSTNPILSADCRCLLRDIVLKNVFRRLQKADAVDSGRGGANEEEEVTAFDADDIISVWRRLGKKKLPCSKLTMSR